MSIRYKILALISALLVAALASYLYLATSQLRDDKLAYVYDLNTTLADAASADVRLAVELLAQQASLLAHEVRPAASTSEQNAAAAQRLFVREPEIVQVQLYRLDPASRQLVLAHRFVHGEAVSRSGLGPTQTAEIQALPDAAELEHDGITLRNASVAPRAALLRLAVALEGDEACLVVVHVNAERLLRVFRRAQLRTTYLVGAGGEILAHPEPTRVISREVASDALVAMALTEGSAARGALELEEGGEHWLGAFAKVGVAELIVATRVNRDEALAGVDMLVMRSAYFGLGIVLVTFVVSVFFARALTAPIRALRDATTRLAKGDFDVTIKATSRDEVGELSEHFDAMARSLRSAQSQLVRSERMAAFGQLGAGITHEVKNPLSGIRSLAQVARAKLDDRAKLEEILAMIEKEAGRSLDIVQRFLKFARDGEKQPATIVDTRELVTETSRMARHQLGTHGIELEVDVSPETPPIHGHAGELQQVLLNLVLNAQEAMDGGGKVKLSAGPLSSDRVLITVADTGPGIPEADRHRIFEPFFTTKVGTGTGLGLSIAHNIVVQDLGGQIAVRSEPGWGAIMEITLPRAPAHLLMTPRGTPVLS